MPVSGEIRIVVCSRCTAMLLSKIKDENGEDPFEETLGNFKKEKGAKTDLDLTADELAELIKRYKAIYVKYGHEFPQDPKKQVMASAEAVFRSWNNERAIFTRKLEGIPDSLGTAVNIQEMVFGNRTPRSATGVYFTRDKVSGIKHDILDGTVLFQAQGKDVVAGIRNSLPLEALRDHEDPAFHAIYEELKATGEKLEHKCRDMQDTEFTIEEVNGVPTLYFLPIRNGKRSTKAESVIAYNLVKEGILTKEERRSHLQSESGTLRRTALPADRTERSQSRDRHCQGFRCFPRCCLW